MDAIEQLLDNELGLVGGILIICATVLAFTGKMPIADWQTFTVQVFGVYAGSTAIHKGAVAIASRGRVAAPEKPTAAPATTAEVKS